MKCGNVEVAKRFYQSRDHFGGFGFPVNILLVFLFFDFVEISLLSFKVQFNRLHSLSKADLWCLWRGGGGGRGYGPGVPRGYAAGSISFSSIRNKACTKGQRQVWCDGPAERPSRKEIIDTRQRLFRFK